MKKQIILPLLLLFVLFVTSDINAINKTKVNNIPTKELTTKPLSKFEKRIKRKAAKKAKKKFFKKLILPFVLLASLTLILALGLKGSWLFGILFLNFIVLVGYYFLTKGGSPSDLKIAHTTMIITTFINLIGGLFVHLTKKAT